MKRFNHTKEKTEMREAYEASCSTEGNHIQ